MDNPQEGLATIPAQQDEPAVTLSPSPVTPYEILASLDKAIAESSEDVKKRLTDAPPAKRVSAGNVDRAKQLILDRTPQSPFGVPIEYIKTTMTNFTKDEVEQALYELRKMNMLGVINSFYYRRRLR